MNTKKTYDDEFKSKVILEVLREELTMAEISSKYEVNKCSIRDWHKQFLKNMHLAINPAKGVEKYRETIKKITNEKDELYKEYGKITAQLNWAKKKSEELGLVY